MNNTTFHTVISSLHLLRPGPGNPLPYIGVPGEDLSSRAEWQGIHNGRLVLEEAVVVKLGLHLAPHLRELVDLGGQGLWHLLADGRAGAREQEVPVIADLVLPAGSSRQNHVGSSPRRSLWRGVPGLALSPLGYRSINLAAIPN